MYIGKTLNMDSCSKFWGNLEGIWGNPGEIPHIGWKIPGVYREIFLWELQLEVIVFPFSLLSIGVLLVERLMSVLQH